MPPYVVVVTARSYARSCSRPATNAAGAPSAWSGVVRTRATSGSRASRTPPGSNVATCTRAPRVREGERVHRRQGEQQVAEAAEQLDDEHLARAARDALRADASRVDVGVRGGDLVPGVRVGQQPPATGRRPAAQGQVEVVREHLGLAHRPEQGGPLERRLGAWSAGPDERQVVVEDREQRPALGRQAGGEGQRGDVGRLQQRRHLVGAAPSR